MSCKSLFPIAAVGACVAVGLVPPIAGAETFVVGTTADAADYAPGNGICDANPSPPTVCTLRAAIEEANAWPGTDVIEVPAGTYVLDGGGRLHISESLQINGEGMYDTIVDGNHGHSVFSIAGDTTVVDMNDLAVQNGKVLMDGGGIYVSEARLNLYRCRVADNTVMNGAGGGICVYSGVLHVESSIITNNTAPSSYAGYGGGICAWVWSRISLTQSTISGNEASHGGGIWAEELHMDHSSVFGNSARYYSGGGIDLWAVADSYLLNSTIAGNSSGRHGGGIAVLFQGPATVHLNNVTITDNDADGYGDGGGIYHNSTWPGSVSLSNTIVAGNHDGSAGTWHPDCSGPFVTQGHNLIGNNIGCPASFPAGTPNANDDWVGSSPATIDPMLALDSWSWIGDVYYPLYGSPAIDHGCPGSGPGTPCETDDQLGWLRPIDGDGDSAAVCDIGAIEFRDCNNNDVYDSEDAFTGTSRDCNGDYFPDECVTQCTDDCECFDGDPCTDDYCVTGSCQHGPALYGDVDFNGAVNVFDIFCIRDAIVGDYHCGHWWELDINPCTPNGVLNIFDMIAIRDVIAGYPPCCNP